MLSAIRVDASSDMGLGHLHRCIALAHALRQYGSDVVFLTRPLGIDSTARIIAAGFDVYSLPFPLGTPPSPPPTHAAWAGVHWATDAEETISALAGKSVYWLVVDSYALDARWHEAVSRGVRTPIAVIDDLGDRPLRAEVLIDHNVAIPDHFRKYLTKLNPNATVLGGPTFALLGPKYAVATRYRPAKGVSSVGIFLGGTDPRNLSAKVLRACREDAGFEGDIELVTTRANPRCGDLQTLATSWPRTTVSIDVPDLSEFFARHDIQIGAGGGAIWERCCIGAPTLALICAENQLFSLPLLHQLGAVELASDPKHWREITSAEIAKCLRDLISSPERRAQLSQTSQALVDGHGAQRVAQWLIQHKGNAM